jgi:hypothetical protein
LPLCKLHFYRAFHFFGMKKLGCQLMSTISYFQEYWHPHLFQFYKGTNMCKKKTTLIKFVDKLGTSSPWAMYWLNSNHIFVTYIDLHTIVNRFLSESQSQMHTTNLNLALALSNFVTKESQSNHFQTARISLVMWVVQTIAIVFVALSYTNDVVFFLSMTSSKATMLST